MSIYFIWAHLLKDGSLSYMISFIKMIIYFIWSVLFKKSLYYPVKFLYIIKYLLEATLVQS